MSDNQPCVNTDRELWREVDGDYYAPRVFVTTDGGIGIDVGGFTIVKTVRQWHALGAATIGTPAPRPRIREGMGLSENLIVVPKDRGDGQ